MILYPELDLYCADCKTAKRFVWDEAANQRLCFDCKCKESRIVQDGYMRQNLNIIRMRYLRKKFDWVNVTVGYERMGKSTHEIQDCLYIDPTFTEERIVTTMKELFKILKVVKPGEAIQLDEGGIQLMSREAMSPWNKKIIKALMIVGAKCCFISIVLPALNMLDSYVRYHRVCSVINIKRRGTFQFYSRKRAKQLAFWHDKDKINPFSHVRPNFTGTFSAFNPFEEAYLKKKHAGIAEFIKDTMREEKQTDFLTTIQLSAFLHASRISVYNWIRNGKLKAVVGMGKNQKQIYLVHKDEAGRFKEALDAQLGSTRDIAGNMRIKEMTPGQLLPGYNNKKGDGEFDDMPE